ncbi:hypothetical protein BpHYR1_038778 [Brachionus plicatilis]|uniref:Uncharacterized protein n=1 Tax=Brachionus plicatilis TaxID=10195 RepID=A0A3M7SZ68_BRAPC|nr:hypothetical protein BpHYR1_038778 [Brachionus plicatilis]
MLVFDVNGETVYLNCARGIPHEQLVVHQRSTVRFALERGLGDGFLRNSLNEFIFVFAQEDFVSCLLFRIAVECGPRAHFGPGLGVQSGLDFIHFGAVIIQLFHEMVVNVEYGLTAYVMVLQDFWI